MNFLRRVVAIDVILTGSVFLCMTGIAGIGIVFRFVLNDPLIWGDEVVRLLFSWFTFLGMSVVVRHGSHLRLTVIDDLFPGPVSRNLNRFGLLVTAAMAGVLIYYGIDLCITQLGNSFASIPISRAWSFAALPVGGTFLVVQIGLTLFDSVHTQSIEADQ